MSAAERELRAAEAMMEEAERVAGPLPPRVAAAAAEHLAILRARAEEKGGE